MTVTHTRSELLALSQGPIPRLLPSDYTNLGNLRLLQRMRTSRSRRKKKRKKNEKRLSNTDAALCLINARDLRTFSTSAKVSRLLANSCPDLLAVTETWFTDAAGDYDARSICPPGYSALQKPRDLVRENKLGRGGLALFHKNSIKATVLKELPDFASFEHLDVSISIRSTKVRLIIIYRPPNKSCAEFLREFSSLLESTSTVSSALVIIGDFNLHVDVATDIYAQRFSATVESVGFRQHVCQPTRNKGHTLDLAFHVAPTILLTQHSLMTASVSRTTLSSTARWASALQGGPRRPSPLDPSGPLIWMHFSPICRDFRLSRRHLTLLMTEWLNTTTDFVPSWISMHLPRRKLSYCAQTLPGCQTHYVSLKRSNVGPRDAGELPKGKVISGSNGSGECTRGTDPTTPALSTRQEYALFGNRWSSATVTSVPCSVWLGT